MSVDIRLPFGRFLRLAIAEYRSQCEAPGASMSAAMLEQQIDRCHEAWHQARSTRARSTTFLPPTPEEVEKYSQEIGYPLDGVAWCLHYEVKGWHTSTAKMRNWHAAVRNWKRNGWHTKQTPKSTAPIPYLQEPARWLDFMLRNYPDWVEFKNVADRMPTWDSLPPQTKQTVRELMEREPARAPIA